ncbi:hypothetical protein AURDEDRAFT_116296 [Auricularia subglabra TFB-10046 SS5]|nr:hypothetical protein AURDEDRAFT_116296 [Auricularia subglabra TFB-10046 SS5]
MLAHQRCGCINTAVQVHRLCATARQGQTQKMNQGLLAPAVQKSNVRPETRKKEANRSPVLGYAGHPNTI